jgi:rhodanese-related sulfurtransferase
VTDDIEVTAQEAHARLDAGEVQLVDVREPAEWEAGRPAGDVRHIPMGELTAQAGTLDAGRPVVFSCRSGARSLMAAQAFRASGFEAYSLAGGLLAWQEAGLPLDPPDGTVAGH